MMAIALQGSAGRAFGAITCPLRHYMVVWCFGSLATRVPESRGATSTPAGLTLVIIIFTILRTAAAPLMHMAFARSHIPAALIIRGKNL